MRPVRELLQEPPRQARTAAARLLLAHRLTRLVPIPVPPTGCQEVRMFFGHRSVTQALAAAYSFLRFRALPLVVHEDGTLTRGDWRRVTALFPGAHLIEARRGKARTMAELARRGLYRLAQFRLSHTFGPKLLDVPLFAEGRTVLYLDSDVLAHREPAVLFEALERGHWVYNEDVGTQYALTLPLPPGVNAGLIAVGTGDVEEDWRTMDAALGNPVVPGQEWYLEQTLWALAMALHQGRPLPPEYDVCVRHARKGAAEYDSIVTQHYCSHQRRHFEERFLAEVVGRRGWPVRAGRHLGVR